MSKNSDLLIDVKYGEDTIGLWDKEKEVFTRNENFQKIVDFHNDINRDVEVMVNILSQHNTSKNNEIYYDTFISFAKKPCKRTILHRKANSL